MRTISKNCSRSVAANVARPGALLNQISFAPAIEKQYYWWDNILDAGRSLSIFHKWQDSNFGTNYKIVKGNDDWWEIGEISKRKMIGLYNGDKAQATLTNSLTFSVGASAGIDTLTFDGTSIKIRAYKSTAKGIGRFILFNGVCRGYLIVGTNGPNAVNADKAAGRYYVIMQAGSYTNIDASMGSLQLYDLIYYNGTSWQIIHQADYTYVDVDFYFSGTSAVETYTLFTGLSAGSHTMAVVPLNTKNAASSAYIVSPRQGSVVKERSFNIEGGTSLNYTELVAHLIPNPLPHFTMATTISKAESEQAPNWIPSHNGETSLIYDDGETMQNWVDDVEITGNLLSDSALIQCDDYLLTNVAYAYHDDAPSEKLIKVTSSLHITIAGVNSKFKYDVLADSLISTMYCVQLPWLYTVFNRFVSDKKEELTLPANLQTTNIQSAAQRGQMFVYNNTPSGDYENIIFLFTIPNPAANGRGETTQSFLYNMGSDRGKAYVIGASEEVFETGYSYENEVNINAGYVPDLIAKVADYL